MNSFLKIVCAFAVSIIVMYICMCAYIVFLRHRDKDAHARSKEIRKFTADELAQYEKQVAVEAMNKYFESEDDAIYHRRVAITDEQNKIILAMKSIY